MARLPRLSMAGCLHHVVQRGNNGQSIFQSAADFERMLGLLHEHARSAQVAVHAYVLMDNQLHLLVTPTDDDALPRMMQSVGRAYVRYFNDRHGRTGTLWEGRYRSTILQPERYLTAAMVYIDLCPVRAGLAEHAQDYPWSSCGHYMGARVDRLITPHALYWGLGNTPFAREAAYGQQITFGFEARQPVALSENDLRGWALGDAQFVRALQEKTPRRLSKLAAGRPRRAALPEADTSI